MSELDRLRVRDNLLEPPGSDDFAKQGRVWIPNPKEGFILASIQKDVATEDTVEVIALESGEKRKVDRDHVHRVNPPRYDKCEDMSGMTSLNEAAVLHNMKQRYYSNLIYTYSGLFCVVVNPYCNLPIYTDSIADAFKGKNRTEMPPHIFAVADEAYRNMLQNREDQSILCTGESGAGKTENAKKIIQYLAHVAGSRKIKTDLDTSGRSFVALLEDQLLNANPILEAFGNSKTVKNDNSSRFGKFVRVHFDAAGFICGANIEFYLLEKSRLLRQAANERTFHIFYQLIKGASKELREELLLEDSPSKYRFLSNDDIRIPGVDDAKNFQNTMDAMTIMGFSDDEIKAIFRVLSALLLFGNLEFAPEGKNSDQAIIANDAVAQKIAKLLNVNFTDLVKAFLKPKIRVHGDHAHRSQNEEQARFSVEAIAKATYERLFRWLVRRLNRSLDRTRQNAVSFIGILDIAGFEIFDMNSFEQLCINYTNEKLQQLFNNTMFIKEQQEYLNEGLDWDMIDFGLNLQPTIDLIEKPMGILAILDDICLFPGTTDVSLVEKLVHEHQKHPNFIVPERRSQSDFAVVHYAGRVDYKAAEWRTKNMDPLNDNVVELLQTSKELLVAEIWKDTTDVCKMSATEMGDSIFGSRVKKGLFRTISQLYKEQLFSLMNTLNNTSPHFVRCIIPNHDKKAGYLNAQLVLDQLRCNGVLEGIRICRQGFPNRLPFQEIRQRYGGLLTPQIVANNFLDGRETAKKILDVLDIPSTLYRIGQSKVFFRCGVVGKLEQLRDEKISSLMITFQAVCRASLARKRLNLLKEQANAAQIIQRNGRAWMQLRNWEWWKLYIKIDKIAATEYKNEKMEEMEVELEQARDEIKNSQIKYSELESRLHQVEEDREKIQQRLDAEFLEVAERDEELKRYKNLIKTHSDRVEELEKLLADERDKRKAVEDEIVILKQLIHDGDDRLKHERDRSEQLLADKNRIEKKLKELEDSKLGSDEASSRLLKEKQQLESKFKDLADKLMVAKDSNEDLLQEKEKLHAESINHKMQLDQIKSKLIREHSEEIEEMKRKTWQELQSAKSSAEDELAARQKIEKIKNKLQQENDDLSRELTNMTLEYKEMERKQRRFDQQLAEEKKNTATARDQFYESQRQMSDMETKLLNSQKEITSLKEAIFHSERKLSEMKAALADMMAIGMTFVNPVNHNRTIE